MNRGYRHEIDNWKEESFREVIEEKFLKVGTGEPPDGKGLVGANGIRIISCSIVGWPSSRRHLPLGGETELLGGYNWTIGQLDNNEK